jgi:DNA primase
MTELEIKQADFQTRGISCGYWTGRGVSEEIIVKYRLGFDLQKNAATIPFYENDTLVGIVGRRAAKTVVKEKFFGYMFARKDNLYFPGGVVPQNPDVLLMVEGTLDAIKCQELGVPNVIAQYCLVPNNRQIERLKSINPKKIVGLLDSDAAGREGGEWFIKTLYPLFPAVETICLPQDGIDPWEYAELEKFLLEKKLITHI